MLSKRRQRKPSREESRDHLGPGKNSGRLTWETLKESKCHQSLWETKQAYQLFSDLQILCLLPRKTVPPVWGFLKGNQRNAECTSWGNSILNSSTGTVSDARLRGRETTDVNCLLF